MEKQYTKKQLEVINANSGYNMVLAGPGCGKTDILAERIKRAYERGDAELSDMLCLTFTNRAARGMFTRIQSHLGSESSDLFVGNIHRYCSHFLFDDGVVSAEASILDEDDTNEVLSTEISDTDIKELLGYESEITKIGLLISFDWDIVHDLLGIDIYPSGNTGKVQSGTASKVISAAKGKIYELQHLIVQINMKHPQCDWYHGQLLEAPMLKRYFTFKRELELACERAQYTEETFMGKDPISQFFDLAAKFGTYKQDNGLLDFDDLLILTYDAYYNDTEHKYKRYKWVQIDEIQDLSNFQISLVDLITDKEKDFVVLYLGDEQQAIYSFMGASLETLNMLKDRCLNHIYRLDKNFRSPKYLLDIYNEYAIKQLKVDKDFLPEPKDDKQADFYDVCIHAYETTEEETNRVYNAVLPYLREEGRENERTALLVPWNMDANEISDRLKKDKISHFKISGLDSFQTVHMKTLMAHFNAVDNDFNIIAWARILKQTYAVDTYYDGRHLFKGMRLRGMCPSDLMRETGTYLSDFVDCFDNKEIVLYDTETTGVDVFNDDIVQIAAVKIRNGVIVPNSSFNIFLELADRSIPEKLGKKINPMVEAYKTARKIPRKEGLELFMQYVGNAILMGHNVNYDYNILKFNLKKYCDKQYHDFEATTIDTLKLAHLIQPHLKKYKLEYLIEHLNLEGTNSHMADDDIMATYELAKYCRTKAQLFITLQETFLEEKRVKQAKEELRYGYKECYERTKRNLFELHDTDSEYAIVQEMIDSSEQLVKICELRPVDSFDLIVSFIREDVIGKEEANALKTHFSNHLMDMSTYREADLCSSSNFKENLFVSTVHKAKGLEFENVIVMRAIDGRYPHFAHKTAEKQEEDKRLFYVAISRAMKRLIVSGVSSNFTQFIKPILHHFTLRFILFHNYETKILVEIGYDMLRLIKTNKSGRIVRDYKISCIYDKDRTNDQSTPSNLRGIQRILYEQERIHNQFDLKRILQMYSHRADAIDVIDEILLQYGASRS